MFLHHSDDRSGRLLVTIVLFAVLFRLLLVGGRPVLSSDSYRYAWEGRVVLAGKNPFLLAPEDPSLEFLRDGDFEEINHRDLTTIYPPLAQAAFALGAAISPTVYAQKLVFVAFDVGVMLLLMTFLRRRGRNPALALVYAWNPLVLVEFSHSGHLDSLGIFFLVLALLVLDSGKRAVGFTALALSFLSKYSSAVLLPFFIVRRRHLGWLLLFAAFVIAGYLPFIAARSALFASLRLYATTWEFNSVPFYLLKGLSGDQGTARTVLFVLLALYSVLAARMERDLVHYSYLVIGCALFLSPTVFPWYVAWIVPFLCFYPNPGWIAFTCLVTASYAVLPLYKATGSWVLDEKVLLIEYLPFYLLLIGSRRGVFTPVGRRVARALKR